MQRLSDWMKKGGKICLLAKGKGGNKAKVWQEKTQNCG